MTMHFHGTPITPRSELLKLAGRNFCVSYAAPADVETCHRIGQSVMLDNGAFSFWRKGMEAGPGFWIGYYEWCERWLEYPMTWAVVPDVIDGTEEENDRLLTHWYARALPKGAPVWHLHESLDRLLRLAIGYDRVCIGSSGAYSTIGTPQWCHRMAEAFDVLCVDFLPRTRVHMLRGMGVVQDFPFASVDSTDVARNHNRPQNDAGRMAQRWDSMQSPPRWIHSAQESLDGMAA